jgi:two-component system, response regulator
MNEKVIFLIEDNSADIELTLHAFKKSRIRNRVVVARDGEAALDSLFGAGEFASKNYLPTLILLDLKLPKVDGLDVLARIRQEEKTKHLPVIILTTSREQQDMIRGYALGANSYIVKPVDFSNFVEAVNQLQLYWMVLNEVPGDV